MSEPMPPEKMANYWPEFINGHIPKFDLSPLEQIDNYVKECWEAIVDTTIWAEKNLPRVLDEVRPDLVCVDNVILFPAIKRYARDQGKPWVRIISCSENEIPDPDIPPHLSGCGENDQDCFRKYERRFLDVISPIHERFNQFLVATGEDPYPIGQFFQASPCMNLLLYPEPVKFKRRQPLDPDQFQYLEWCVREEASYEIPVFGSNNDRSLLYVSFGSLGSGDTKLLRRLMMAVAKLPVRALFNLGYYTDQYAATEIPANVHVAAWYPQPSVIAQADAVIHHGGNNSFNECLYFGKPALDMPYVWDGHDNTQRVAETGHGLHLHRNVWSEEELARCIDRLLNDDAMKLKLPATSAHMQARHGPSRAAEILDKMILP